jgi:hypothetical protein
MHKSIGSDEDNLLNITIKNNSTANYSITGIDLSNTGKFYPFRNVHYTTAYMLVRIKIIIYKSMCTISAEAEFLVILRTCI